MTEPTIIGSAPAIPASRSNPGHAFESQEANGGHSKIFFKLAGLDRLVRCRSINAKLQRYVSHPGDSSLDCWALWPPSRSCGDWSMLETKASRSKAKPLSSPSGWIREGVYHHDYDTQCRLTRITNPLGPSSQRVCCSRIRICRPRWSCRCFAKPAFSARSTWWSRPMANTVPGFGR